ncbi:hypothetical protein [Saccharolobus islandicus]|uniref:Uncharacterized protein n=1 Tax=Saccharolobus islandicus (strain REY15A) TaxID=930945 RepID=F0NH17_SACI5|nr:hypothetical protein [Sulfolobus islandicus]ADX84585.1 hypothetical protein SiRe_0499 [Sulfolobus islandicus REY15A]
MRKYLLALLTLSLALLSFLITPTIARVIIPPSSPIPINSVGSTTTLNFQGYVFGFENNNQPQPLTYAQINIPIPSSLPSYFNTSLIGGNVDKYAIWVALSPYPASNYSGNYFVQAAIVLIANTSGQYLNLAVCFVQSGLGATFYNKTFPLSKFAGTMIQISLCYSNGLTAQFYDPNNGFSQSVIDSQYVFVPYSALIIGEIPLNVQLTKTYYVFFYPVPNETFSNIQFNVIGTPSTSAEVFTYSYNLSSTILTAITKTTNQYYGFHWLSNGNSYSANAYTSSSGAQITGTVQLAYSETPLFPTNYYA